MSNTDAAAGRIEKRRNARAATTPIADHWRELPEYRSAIRILERRGQLVSLDAAHGMTMRVSETLLAVRKELQIDGAKLLPAAYTFLAPARDLLQRRALSLEELRRLRLKPAVWQRWANSENTGKQTKEPIHLERQLRFIEHVGIDAAFDLLEIIENAVPAGAPRQRGPAFTAEQNVELLRKLASGVSLRKMAEQLAHQYPPLPGQNAPAYPPTHGAIRDRRDDIWKAVAEELDALMPRKAAPKRVYPKNPKRGQQFWTKQGVDDADLHDGETSKPDRPCGAELFASLRRVKQNTHTALQKIWSYS